MMDPDYDVFLEIAMEKSLSAAARTLRLSPASVSKRLARLEAKLGARLVQRTTRRMALTPQGQQLFTDLESVAATLRRAESRFRAESSQPGGPLRLTAPTSFGRMHLAPCLARFAEMHPNIELTIDLSDSFVDLLASPYDAAIRIAVDVGSGLVGHRLMGSRRVLCAAPAYLVRRGAPQNLVELERHALLAAEGQLPWQLEGPEGHVVFQGRSAIQTNSSEVVREIAAGGRGIALRSMWDVADLLRRGDLVQILPDYEGAREAAVYLVHTPTPHLPANIATLLTYLDTELRDV